MSSFNHTLRTTFERDNKNHYCNYKFFFFFFFKMAIDKDLYVVMKEFLGEAKVDETVNKEL